MLYYLTVDESVVYITDEYEVPLFLTADVDDSCPTDWHEFASSPPKCWSTTKSYKTFDTMQPTTQDGQQSHWTVLISE